MIPTDERADIAMALITGLNREGIEGRLFGGAAFAIACYWDGVFRRSRRIKDIDLVVPAGAYKGIPSIIRKLGGAVDRAAVLLNEGRLIRASFRGILVDIYSDPLFLNQEIALGARLTLEEYCLAPADLLATKLQINAHTERDARDIVALLSACELVDSDGIRMANIRRIVELCSRTWNFYYASKRSLALITNVMGEFDVGEAESRLIFKKVSYLLSEIERPPKSMLWKCRAVIGPRMRWYSDIDAGLAR